MIEMAAAGETSQRAPRTVRVEQLMGTPYTITAYEKSLQAALDQAGF